MEAKGHDRMFTVCALEMFGTALFLFGIISQNSAIIIPFMLLAPVVIFGDVTGGHFNPAVTLGVFLTLGDYGKNLVFMIMIWISQILGGLLGIGLAWLGAFGKTDAMVPVLAPFNPVQGGPDRAKNELEFSMDMQVVTNEVVCTFIFVSVILMVKGKHTAGNR